MPQGRKRVPFSGKAKKLQLQAKKQGKISFIPQQSSSNELASNSSAYDSIVNVQKLNKGGRNATRYALQFHRETDDEIRKLKELGRHELKSCLPTDLEVNGDEYFSGFDFPKRPHWETGISVESLEKNEHRYFTEYVKTLEKNNAGKSLSYFELNLETWRQLWRVLEMSDIILIIVDIRFPALMFPPSLYKYVTDTLKKDMILVINKIDLVPAPTVVAWKHYFQQKYPELHVLLFTSFPGYNLKGNTSNRTGLKIRQRKGKLRMACEGAESLLKACKEIVANDVDLTSWESKIREEMSTEYDNDEVEISETIIQKEDTEFSEHEKFKNGILTIGCVGQPNVGKSSLMNAIMGKKVVSVSKTPGHTKHFQTIFLTNTVRLCDCPGLVFPSAVPKSIQILMGSFPIAQLREPFSAIRFVAERMDLPKLLSITHPDNEESWSPYYICESWALKKGFLTAKAARPDINRAANSLLRMTLDGKICLSLAPPGYNSNKGFWNKHEDVEVVEKIQAITTDMQSTPEPEEEISDDEETASVNSNSGTDAIESESEDEENLSLGNKFALLMDQNN